MNINEIKSLYGKVCREQEFGDVLGSADFKLIREALNELVKLKVDGNDELEDYKRIFDLRWKASLRASKRWQKATGRALVFPDHADLCVWLLEQLDLKNDVIKELKGDLRKRVCNVEKQLKKRKKDKSNMIYI